MTELKPCPFCKGITHILVCDDEGNIHDEEYEKHPWSGLKYALAHYHEENENCPIATYKNDGVILGVYLYDTKEEAIAAWNRRASDAEQGRMAE